MFVSELLPHIAAGRSDSKHNNKLEDETHERKNEQNNRHQSPSETGYQLERLVLWQETN